MLFFFLQLLEWIESKYVYCYEKLAQRKQMRADLQGALKYNAKQRLTRLERYRTEFRKNVNANCLEWANFSEKRVINGIVCTSYFSTPLGEKESGRGTTLGGREKIRNAVVRKVRVLKMCERFTFL